MVVTESFRTRLRGAGFRRRHRTAARPDRAAPVPGLHATAGRHRARTLNMVVIKLPVVAAHHPARTLTCS